MSTGINKLATKIKIIKRAKWNSLRKQTKAASGNCNCTFTEILKNSSSYKLSLQHTSFTLCVSKTTEKQDFPFDWSLLSLHVLSLPQGILPVGQDPNSSTRTSMHPSQMLKPPQLAPFWCEGVEDFPWQIKFGIKKNIKKKILD